MNTLFNGTHIINRNQHFLIACKFFVTQTRLQVFGTKCYRYVSIFLEKIFHTRRVNRCFKSRKYNYTLHCKKTTSRILQFLCYGYFEDLLAPKTFAENFGFLAGVVSKIFAIKNALQSKDQFLRSSPHQIKVIYSYHNNCAQKLRLIYCISQIQCFCQEVQFTFFYKGKQPQNL